MMMVVMAGPVAVGMAVRTMLMIMVVIMVVPVLVAGRMIGVVVQWAHPQTPMSHRAGRGSIASLPPDQGFGAARRR